MVRLPSLATETEPNTLLGMGEIPIAATTTAASVTAAVAAV